MMKYVPQSIAATEGYEVWMCSECSLYMEYPPTKGVEPFCMACTALSCFGSSLPVSNNLEELGKVVRQVWIDYVKREMPHAKESWILPWDKCPEHVREVDRLIGDTIVSLFLARFETSGLAEILSNIITYRASSTGIIKVNAKEAFDVMLASIEALPLEGNKPPAP